MLSPVAATLPRLRWIASLGTSPLKRSTHSPFRTNWLREAQERRRPLPPLLSARADNKGGKGLRRSCASRSQFVRNGECVDRFKGDVPKDAIQRNLGNVAATGDSISGTFSKIGYRRVCDSRSQVLVGGECVGRN